MLTRRALKQLLHNPWQCLASPPARVCVQLRSCNSTTLLCESAVMLFSCTPRHQMVQLKLHIGVCMCDA
jgi:hypothetical protein